MFLTDFFDLVAAFSRLPPKATYTLLAWYLHKRNLIDTLDLHEMRDLYHFLSELSSIPNTPSDHQLEWLATELDIFLEDAEEEYKEIQQI